MLEGHEFVGFADLGEDEGTGEVEGPVCGCFGGREAPMLAGETGVFEAFSEGGGEEVEDV